MTVQPEKNTRWRLKGTVVDGDSVVINEVANGRVYYTSVRSDFGGNRTLAAFVENFEPVDEVKDATRLTTADLVLLLTKEFTRYSLMTPARVAALRAELNARVPARASS